jgi:hypothetical protein
MDPKGKELEDALKKSLAQRFILADSQALDKEAIDIAVTGSTTFGSAMFDPMIGVQVCTRSGDLEKIADFRQRATARGFKKLIYLELLVEEISGTVSDAIATAILSVAYCRNHSHAIIVTVTEEGYWVFNLLYILGEYKEQLKGLQSRLLSGKLVSWKRTSLRRVQPRSIRTDDEGTDPNILRQDGFGILEYPMVITSEILLGKPFCGFTRFFVKGEDLDSDIFPLLDKDGPQNRRIEVLFEDGGIDPGHERRHAKRVLLKSHEGETQTIEQPAQRPPRRPPREPGEIFADCFHGDDDEADIEDNVGGHD